jgi:redox-sensing transcriptional repressor
MRELDELIANDVKVISSERLAKQCGVNPSQIRKDLSYFGEFGVRGVGYQTKGLHSEIKNILGLNHEWFVVAFDVDPQKIGRPLSNGLVIEHTDRFEDIVKERNVEIGVIAVPPGSAQIVANLLILEGINGILNFSPVQIQVPDCCRVENVDFSIKLDNLAYHISSIT